MMTNKNRINLKALNNKKRCCYSSKYVGNRSVVLVDYIQEYLSKLKASVNGSPATFISRSGMEKYFYNYLKNLGYIISNKPYLSFVFMFIFMISFVSAQSPLLAVDFSDRSNIVFMFVGFVAGALLLFFRYTMYSAFIFVLMGLLMLFNDINFVISFITIGAGVIIAFID